MSFHSLCHLSLWFPPLFPTCSLYAKGTNKHHRLTGKLMSLDASAQTRSPNKAFGNIFVEVSFYHHCSFSVPQFSVSGQNKIERNLLFPAY